MCGEGRTPPARVSTHEGAPEEAALTADVGEGDGAAWRRAATVRQVEDSGRSPASRDTGINWGGARGSIWSCCGEIGTADGGNLRRTVPGEEGWRARRVTPEDPALDKARRGAGGVESATLGGPKVSVFGPPGVGEGVTTRVAPGGNGTGMEDVVMTAGAAELIAVFFCLAGGTTSWASTRALFADFSTTALQISYDRCKLTLPIGGLFLLVRAVGLEACKIIDDQEKIIKKKINLQHPFEGLC